MSKWYGCLVEDCQRVFETWGEARKHMKLCGPVDGYMKNGQFCKKPNINDSAAKGASIYGHAPDRRSAPEENYVLEESAATEEELVDLVREYYAKGPATYNYRKDVIAKAIRPKWGHFPFHKFGFGTFEEFSSRHGLSIQGEKSGAPNSLRISPY